MNPLPTTETAAELLTIVRNGQEATRKLDKICSSIYAQYLMEIKRQKDALAVDYPSYDSRGYEAISDLMNCNKGYYSFEIRDNLLHLQGRDYFRSETNYETDTVPLQLLFIADPLERQEILKAFVGTKIDPIRKRLEDEKLFDETQARATYAELKERFEPN